MDYKKVAFIIADDAEFAPVKKYCVAVGGEVFERHTNEYCRFVESKCEIVAVLCGIGKVNAAASAAAVIIEEAPDCMINFGLSGAVSGVRKNEIVLGRKFYEHDFDLTPLGYKIGEKSKKSEVLCSDNELCDMILSADSSIKSGNFVTGDSFIASAEKSRFVAEYFGANCCDMETAAIASVCRDYGVKYASLRYCSDNADDNASESYNEINDLQEDTLLKIVLKALK